MLSLILISSAKVNFFDCFEPPGGKEIDEICSKMGLTMTSAINVFLSKTSVGAGALMTRTEWFTI